MKNFEKEKLVTELIDYLDLECMDTANDVIQAATYYITRVILKRDFDIEVTTRELDSAKGLHMDCIQEGIETEIEKRLYHSLSRNNYDEAVLRTHTKKEFIGRAS